MLRPAGLAGHAKRLELALRRVDPALYALWAAYCTLASARLFYGFMMKQTGGEWSAPLDDVFIHFDYARAIAQGHPFEWVAGNGYSSGNTSVTYPFVLALGYVLGFHDLALMKWAALLAMVCTFGTLLAGRSLFLRSASGRGEGMRWLSYLLPPVLLGLGALDWSLWSGMEVAFFLGVWACALLAFFALDDARGRELRGRAWALGAWCLLLVATRPEAATTVAVFGLVAAFWRKDRLRASERAAMLLRVGAPGVAFLVLQTLANRAFTGEYSANGAIVKLALNNPFMLPREKLADYTFNLTYTVLRNVEYHFTDAPALGFLVPALALAALAVPATRRVGVLLWLQIAGWLLLVAFNGQVRWQNERYTMPAVAWLLTLAALGAAAMLRRLGRPSVVFGLLAGTAAVELVGIVTRPAGTMPSLRVPLAYAAGAGLGVALVLRFWPARALAVAAALFLAHDHQVSKMRDQKWFFGRACRNIRDQHIVAGRMLAQLHPHRVLVGDAGALMYASGRPGLDIIGLGGYHDLPFARAGVQGLPASIELIERMPPADRPDMFAIYPSWWGVLPTWFAHDVVARVPAHGNVICGGYEDVLYTADWSPLGKGDRPRAALSGRVVDSVDVADLVSEREHRYVFPHPAGGWTEMKILQDPADATQDFFDAGRRISGGRGESMRLGHLRPGAAATLIVRSAPNVPAHVRVLAGGQVVGALDFTAADGWVEKTLTIPASAVRSSMDLRLQNDGPGDFLDYHVWVAQ